LPLKTLESVADLGGPKWLVDRREEGRSAFERMGIPSATQEVWRYSPIGNLELERFAPALAEKVNEDIIPPQLLENAATVVRVLGGTPQIASHDLAGLSVTTASAHAEGQELLGSVVGGHETIVALNDGYLSDAIIIDVKRGALIEQPIVIVHHVAPGASFPRTFVRMGDGAVATVIEVAIGGAGETLNVPVTEMDVAERANLRYGAIQLLGSEAWHLATIDAKVEKDGVINEFTAGLGGRYDRCRSDVALVGQGASSMLRATYLGSGEQIHDLRTKQDHIAPKTQSDLLCKGAVFGTSRSIYTGLIKMQKGAMRSDAMQTNHNLVLSETARADSVPNLDITENDVRCSHASTVGPIDEDQRYYLESRGIDPEHAQGLLVRGFFKDLLDRTTVPIAPALAGLVIEERVEDEGI